MVTSKPHPFLLSQLERLKVRCNNFDRGCHEQIAWKDHFQHQFDCSYATVKCPMFECNDEFLQKDYAEHAKVCEFRIIDCPQCGFRMLKADGDHNCTEETQRAFK